MSANGGENLITERQKQILNLIISLYARERAPVGSKSLLEAIHASSATIRNDMKALEEEGLIQKEHTSSGRIPSVSGYKYFVEHIIQPENLTQTDVFAVMKEFDGDFHRLSNLMEVATRTLSNLTGLTSILLNVPQAEQVLANFDIVSLDSHSVLAVISLNTGEVRTNPFILPKSMTADDLLVFRRIVWERLVGKKLLEVHYALRTEIPQIAGRYIKTTSDMIALFDQVFEDLFREKLVIAGQQQLFNYGTLEVYKLLADHDLLIQEIRDLTQGEEPQAVKFDSAIGDLTLIAQKFVVPYRGLGTLAVLGPVAMDYQKTLAVLGLVARILTLKLTDYYRYADGNHYEIT